MTPTLADTLSVLLPSADETVLLTACLASGERARAAWTRWRERQGPGDEALRHALVARRALLPLLSASASANDLDAGRGLLPYLRGAALREELRATRFRQLAAEILTQLQRDGTTPWLVRGAALAAVAYPAWGLRHCHDLDLLVVPEALERAVGTLVRAGAAALAPSPWAPGTVLLRHPSALQVALHTRPFAVRYYDAPVAHFTRDDATIDLDGVGVRTPSRAASMVHVLGHATYSPSRHNLRWVADAWHLAACRPGLDWEEVAARVDAYRLTLPVFVLLRYLAALGVPVPSEPLARLAAGAARAGRVVEEVALGGAHAAARGNLRSLWQATVSWRGRARLARWVAAPSPAYMRSAYAVPSAWVLPLRYLHRPARAVAGKLRRAPAASPAGDDA